MFLNGKADCQRRNDERETKQNRKRKLFFINEHYNCERKTSLKIQLLKLFKLISSSLFAL
jgi:hypothetical protein